MNWSEQYPDYTERLEVMAESVHYWFEYWHFTPYEEPTLVEKQ